MRAALATPRHHRRKQPDLNQGRRIPARSRTSSQGSPLPPPAHAPEITIVWADFAYADQLVTWAKTYLRLTIKTVSRPKDVTGFVVLPRRWVVERTLAWLMHARRHARDYERSPGNTCRRNSASALA
ncbi:transposase [Streptomyces sp. NPDC002082]|uniref:transposase n=1 Tax=Streptomyces sp. NPDC002082 TaxID=3154772 RepID=UPI003322D9C4